MDPLGFILKFMRYACLCYFESMSIMLFLRKGPIHFGKIIWRLDSDIYQYSSPTLST